MCFKKGGESSLSSRNKTIEEKNEKVTHTFSSRESPPSSDVHRIQLRLTRNDPHRSHLHIY